MISISFANEVNQNDVTKGEIILSDIASPLTTDSRYIILAGSLAASIAVLNKEDFSKRLLIESLENLL